MKNLFSKFISNLIEKRQKDNESMEKAKLLILYIKESMQSVIGKSINLYGTNMLSTKATTKFSKK
jgi:hypothetical protein